MDDGEIQGVQKASSGTRRGSATNRGAATQNCRSIASRSGSNPQDPRHWGTNVQSSVMEGLVRKQRRDRDLHGVEIYVPPSFSSSASGLREPEIHPVDERDKRYELLKNPSPMSILGTGRVDPFANYPIQMSREEKWLIDQSKFCIRHAV